MKSTGLRRKVDDLGRVVIPAELRKAFGIRQGDRINISVDQQRIILERSQEQCVFCGSSDDLKEFRDQMVCASCINELTGGDVTAEGKWKAAAQD